LYLSSGSAPSIQLYWTFSSACDALVDEQEDEDLNRTLWDRQMGSWRDTGAERERDFDNKKAEMAEVTVLE
jgi:hypothetical protein